MRALFVGLDYHVVKSFTLTLRVRWPDAEVVLADTGRQGLRDVSELSPDLVILAPELSDIDVLELIEKVRSASDAVVIALATADDDSDIVATLEAGADDCFPASMNGTRFLARIGAAMRRAGTLKDPRDGLLVCGGLEIKPKSFEVFSDGKPLHLTPTEFKVLYHLAKGRGEVVSQHALGSIIWGSSDQFSTDCLRKYIRRLRQKLDGSPNMRAGIVTIPRIGYRLVESI